MIEVKQLNKTYSNGKFEVKALRSINLEVTQGEFVSIMGPSGSGKSTLMNILGCLDTTTSGLYTLDDVDVSSLKDNSLADIRNKKIGFVFQSFNLLPKLSALENVEIPMLYAGLNLKQRRKKVIDQIVAYALVYNLDGINVDFESVGKEDGPYFVQFIKELAPRLRANGIVVSVDCYVPSEWTKHYNRKEISKVVDYIMVMAYDEHWSTSPVSGSVASIGFVKEAIKNTLKEVSREKIILGLPYYTRLWIEKEENKQVKVSSKAYGMDSAYKILKEKNADIKWNSKVGQFYGEYKLDNTTYKIWLEDEKSIEEKVKLMAENNLAGVAGWKKGFEKDAIWSLLEEYLKP